MSRPCVVGVGSHHPSLSLRSLQSLCHLCLRFPESLSLRSLCHLCLRFLESLSLRSLRHLCLSESLSLRSLCHPCQPCLPSLLRNSVDFGDCVGACLVS